MTNMTNLRWIIPFIIIVITVWSSNVEAAKAGTAVSKNPKRVVCYYTNWSAYRPGQAKFLPQNINPYLCTHLIYAFGGFTNEFTLRPFDKWQDIDQGGYAKFNGLKAHNKNLRTLLAIGGWNEGSTRFSKLVADPVTRQNLVKSAIKYLRQHQFDGLDLDWEYPASRDGSKPSDRENYAQLVKDLRDGFNNEKGNRERLLLTMAVPAGIDTIEKGFDIRSLNRDLDFINILSYDYHASTEPQVNHHAPLRPRSNFEDAFDPNEELNIDATVQIYLLNGATADKLVLGIPTYGRAYKLASPDLTDLGSPSDGPAEAGKATREKGYLAYYEICEKIGVENWAVEKPEPEAVGPYAHNGIEWVGYDDEDAVAKKSQYVLDHDLGGIMFWSIDNDDFRGQCTGRQYPLIEAAKAALFGTTLPAINQVSADDRKLSTDTSTSTNTLIRPSLRRPTSNNNNNNNNNNNLRTRGTTSTTVRTTTSLAADFNPFTTPEPPTTPDSVVDFECKEEGFYPNPKDCKKYFWCLDTAAGMVSHIFTCPSGLHFNKFTDSCDYANNVGCKVGAGTGTTTTVKPFLASTTPVRTTARTTTTTTTTSTTTPEPEPLDYVDELTPTLVKTDQTLDSPEELQQLLQLISDLGGVEAVKQLLERNTGRGRKEDGQPIRLSSAQRQALERVIRPSSTRGQAEEEVSPVFSRRPRPNSPQYTSLQRRRPGSQNQRTEELVEQTELAPSSTSRPRLPFRTTTTTEEPQPTAQPQAETSSTSAAEIFDTGVDTEPFEYPTEPESADIFGFEDELIDPFAADELPITSTSTTTTTTTTTTPVPTTSTLPTTTTTTTQRKVVTRRRPLNSRARPTSSASSVSVSRQPITTSPPRAPIVIAIPAPVVRPIGDDFARRPVVPTSAAPSLERPRTANQDDITGDAEVIQGAPVGQNSNGNVVEIDEDGRVFCYDIGNFAYPEDCRKFVQCARGPGRGELEPISGWVHTCPRALSFDPVGAICNWGSPVRCRQI